MATYEEAEQVAFSISKKLEALVGDAFLGVAIDRDRVGYILSVRIERSQATNVKLPSQVDGVRVRVVKGSLAKKLKAPSSRGNPV